MTTLEAGRSSTCLFPRFSVLNLGARGVQYNAECYIHIPACLGWGGLLEVHSMQHAHPLCIVCVLLQPSWSNWDAAHSQVCITMHHKTHPQKPEGHHPRSLTLSSGHRPARKCAPWPPTPWAAVIEGYLNRGRSVGHRQRFD
eukprot:scaffold164311_cov20-Tisochrysis_lutea.AAC.1